jgi:tetratricopeptide (TPR) repeat protein
VHEARIRARARMLPRAFVEELARGDADDASAQAAVAGMVVLRSVDRWVAAGCRGGFDVSGARGTVAQTDERNPARNILGEILDAIAVDGPGGGAVVSERLLAYAMSLEFDAAWAMALAVYESVAQHAEVLSPDEAVATAFLRQGYCLRVLGRLDDARDRYLQGRQAAERSNSLRQVLVAKIGLARLDMAQGNLTKADRSLERVARQAQVANLPGTCSAALHDRAVVAATRGCFDDALRLAFSALELNELPSDRDRILGDIGEVFRELGMREAARDTFLILSCTAQEQFSRWMALIRLMRLAGEDRAEAAFEEYHDLLACAPLPTDLAIEFAFRSGCALHCLGRQTQSVEDLRRGAAIAEAHGFTTELAHIRSALAGEFDIPRSPDAQSGSDVRRIAEAIRELRESAGGGGPVAARSSGVLHLLHRSV